MAKAAHSSLSDRKNKKNRSRPVIAVALVVLVGAGGAWLMFHESGDGLAADESIPWSTMTDDRYVSDEPVDYTPKPRRTPTKSPSASPTRTPSPGETRTPTPDETPTPGDDPTDEPTSDPTSSSSTTTTTDPRPTHRPTSTSRPTHSNSPRPTKTPTSTPPWNDGGGMVDNEQTLFNLINSARKEKGCAALLPDSGLTRSARGFAEESAKANRTGARSGNEAAADGNGRETPNDAYDRMMGAYGGTLMDCGLDRLGVGYAYYEDAPILCGIVTPCVRESRWVATFGYR